MIVLYTTEREYPYGTLRSTNASKVKVILEEKGLRIESNASDQGSMEEAARMLAKHPLGKVPYIDDQWRHCL
jgi:glutathione S-transferase